MPGGQSDRSLLTVALELTPRCNNRCPHCYINQAEDDELVKSQELSFDQLTGLIDQACELGALWVQLTGGEPLLRDDFEEIFTYCKKKGMLISLFTNGTLLTRRHIDLFQKYRPRDIEITVYGVSKLTYGKVTGRADLFEKSIEGIMQIKEAGLPLNLKTTVTKANVDQFQEIADFCRQHSNRLFRFDPFLLLRVDRDIERNRQILSQRLSNRQIIELEKSDPDRSLMMEKKCRELKEYYQFLEKKILRCRAGVNECYINYKGMFQLCHFLCHPSCTCSLMDVSLYDAWQDLVIQARDLCSEDQVYLDACGSCGIREFCMWCPALSDLTLSRLDEFDEDCCRLARDRVNAY